MKIDELGFIPLEKFEIAWRFVDKKYSDLSAEILEKIRALDLESAGIVARKAGDLMDGEIPSSEIFKVHNQMSTADTDTESIRSWLRDKVTELSSDVLVTWSDKLAVTCPFDVFADHIDDFCYPGSDDVQVFPFSTEWILSYHHEERFYFGKRGV